MPTSLSKPASRNKRNRQAVTALIAYSAICAGLLGYFLVFPDEATQKSQAEPSHFVQQGRYEGVITNWARYRARNLTAEAK
jgi:hypothetical protein